MGGTVRSENATCHFKVNLPCLNLFLVGLHENMDMRRREVEEARRKMQMKYNEEAEEAARKKKEVSNNWSECSTVPRFCTTLNFL
jgi:hypothetical protein